jgi:LysR family transcriptional regulator, benzoate and cis,cis-muconate-responsive activator of ben and cat genes
MLSNTYLSSSACLGGMVELRHVRYFLATVECGSVSAAAAALHLTQPGLSRQLRQFERDLEVTLFERRSGRLLPTRTGEALVPIGRSLLDRAAELREAATFIAHGRLDRLTIGAPTVTLTEIVAPFIATLGPDDPTPSVLATEGLTSSESLRRGADLAIGTSSPRAPHVSIPMAVLPVWAYVPPDHPWADRDAVPLAELLGEPLIVLPVSFTSRQAFDAAVAREGAGASTLLETTSATVAQALAAAGRGIALVSDDPRFDLRPLPIDLAEGRLGIRLLTAWDGRHPAASGIEDVARRIGTFVRDRYDVPAT